MGTGGVAGRWAPLLHSDRAQWARGWWSPGSAQSFQVCRLQSKCCGSSLNTSQGVLEVIDTAACNGEAMPRGDIALRLSPAGLFAGRVLREFFRVAGRLLRTSEGMTGGSVF